jgi:hypothetical protein
MGMDHDERFIFQGVHMLYEGKFARAWEKKERRNNLVFIGHNLNREFRHMGVEACLALTTFNGLWETNDGQIRKPNHHQIEKHAQRILLYHHQKQA